jgi:hypothetical protein
MRLQIPGHTVSEAHLRWRKRPRVVRLRSCEPFTLPAKIEMLMVTGVGDEVFERCARVAIHFRLFRLDLTPFGILIVALPPAILVLYLLRIAYLNLLQRAKPARSKIAESGFVLSVFISLGVLILYGACVWPNHCGTDFAEGLGIMIGIAACLVWSVILLAGFVLSKLR